MARRLICEAVIATSKFISLSKKALVLYLALLISSDDEGFVSDPALVLNEVRTSTVALKELEEAGLIELFASGSIHLADFDFFNKTRNDRFIASRCVAEKEQLRKTANKQDLNPGKRRAISSDVVLSSAFLRLPKKAILLYLFLLLATDDEGFIVDPVLTMNKVRATTKVLDTLEEAGFIEVFASDVVHIAEFDSFNHIRKDRLHSTKCTAEKEALALAGKGQNPAEEQTHCSEASAKGANATSLPSQPDDNQTATECPRTDTPTEQNGTERNQTQPSIPSIPPPLTLTIHPLHPPTSHVDVIEW